MQAGPGDVAHGIERPAVNFAHFVNADNVLVFQLGCRLGLCSESLDGLASFLGTQPLQTVRTDHLKSNDALRLELSRFIDHSHSAPADPFQNLIAWNFGESFRLASRH